jgi:protein SCO1/2
MIQPKKSSISIPLKLTIFIYLLINSLVDVNAQINKEPEVLKGIEINEKLDQHIPLSLPFKDENGKSVTLNDYFKKDKPVILNLGYFRCPMLCGLITNGMLDAMKEIKLNPGDDYHVITLSFDPLETPTLAKAKKQNYMKEFGRPEGKSGWHFLTGKNEKYKKTD